MACPLDRFSSVIGPSNAEIPNQGVLTLGHETADVLFAKQVYPDEDKTTFVAHVRSNETCSTRRHFRFERAPSLDGLL